MDQSAPRILLIGRPAPGRLEAATSAVRDSGAEPEFEAAHSISGFRESWSSAVLPPDLILIFQEWPEQFTLEEADWLLATHPTARIICAYSGWCESDGRTRTIWPHAVRVPQQRLTDRLRREIQVVGGVHAPLPLTASRRERFLFDHRPEQALPDVSRYAIRVVSPDRALGDALTELLGQFRQTNDPPDVIFFDVDPWCEKTRSELRGFARHYPRARLVALAGFPGHEPVDEITACGACAVLPKLLTASQLADLFHQL
jgi:hypothetical protein